MMNSVRALVIASVLLKVHGCDVSYDFGYNAHAQANEMSATLTWWQV